MNRVRRLFIVRDGYNVFSRDFWFGQIDSRPLSAFRVVFAAILIKVALYEIPLAAIFYSDEGIVPRSALWAGLARDNRFSLLDAMPYPWMVQALLIGWAMVLFLLMVGYRTKLMSILNLLLIISVQERNLYILNGADIVLRVFSFWMVFVPLGHYYSVDSLFRRLTRYTVSRYPGDLRAPMQPHTAYAFPVRLMQLQLVIIYTFTGLLKMPGAATAWTNGDAVYYALQLKSLTLPTGDWLFNAPSWFLRLIDYQTLVAEVGFGIFMFSPFLQPWLKILGLSLGVITHTGIAATMSIANFSMVMIATYVILLEPGWITWFERKLSVTTATPLTLTASDLRNPLWLLPIMMTTENQLAVEWSSTSADANSKLEGEGAGGLVWKQTVQTVPFSRVWSWALRLPARLGMFAKSITIPLPEPQAQPFRKVTPSGWPQIMFYSLLTMGLTFAMVIVILWNLADFNWSGKHLGPPVVGFPRAFMQYSGLAQNWSMFAPYPTTYDGWIIIPGNFEDGTVLDLRTGGPITDIEYRVFFGPDIRWKKYESNLMEDRQNQLLSAWAGYYCQSYNERLKRPEGTRLATLEIIFRAKNSHAPGQPDNPWYDTMLWKHWCYDKYQY